MGNSNQIVSYDTSVGQSNILMKDGLLFALERLLPEVALPIRLHECRGYKGVKERSFETPLSGLIVRLEDGKGDNLEEGFPISVRVSYGGHGHDSEDLRLQRRSRGDLPERRRRYLS